MTFSSLPRWASSMLICTRFVRERSSKSSQGGTLWPHRKGDGHRGASLVLQVLFFMWNEISMESARSCCRPRPRPSLRSIFLSLAFIRLWAISGFVDIGTKPHVPNRILCKAADLSRRPARGKGVCSDSNWTAQRLQMAARKSLEKMSGMILNRSQPNLKVCSKIGRKWNATCLMKGRLLRFELNSAATSDGGTQKLGNDVWRNSESIATNVCSQIGRKWNVRFESHVVTSVEGTSFDFRFEDFFSNLRL